MRNYNLAIDKVQQALDLGLSIKVDHSSTTVSIKCLGGKKVFLQGYPAISYIDRMSAMEGDDKFFGLSELERGLYLANDYTHLLK